MAITREQFDKLIEEGLTVEEIAEFDNRSQQTPVQETPVQQAQVQQAPQQAQPQQNVMGMLMEAGLLGPLASPQVRGMIGDVARPFTQIGARAGMALGEMVFNKDATTTSFPDILGGDVAPAQNMGEALAPVGWAALNMLGLKGAAGGVKAPKIMKYDKVLKQAEQAKGSLDGLRSTLGKAKDIALQEVKDVPAELNWSGNVSQKVVNAIKNPIYKVEFTPEGGVVNTIGNLDKVKSALQDILTTKDYVEAGNMEKRQIMQFAGNVRDTMVSAAKKAGKPELGKTLKAYHEFMDDYSVINDHLVDKYGNAMGNKLKETFRWTSEGFVKEAWKRIASISPEIKGIVRSRKNRELMKGLLKASPFIAGGAALKRYSD